MNPTALNPSNGRVRIEGTLDAVRASDGTFLLRLDDGRELPGRLVRGSVAGLGRVLGRRLIVFGTARPGGVDVDGFIPNDGQPWTVQPDDLPLSPDVVQEQAQRLKQAVGTWPGDESDEEVERAVRELS
jgi:hypothetical protein